ncbi:MAG TPA: hypothetical protein VJL84_04550 [Kiloniellales bacterium]|nr:hypothetical protein [Kiloniellales bacterium]
MFFRSCCVVTLLALAGCGGSSSQLEVPPESAVAFTQDAQRYGYCYDSIDVSGCAERYCSEGSGRTCQTLFLADQEGYYVLALGNQGWGVGFSASDRDHAGKRAMHQCEQQTEGCREVESWQTDGVK